MSNAVKLSLFIVIVLLLGSLGYTYYVLMEMQKLEGEHVRVSEELTQTDTTLKEKIIELTTANKAITTLTEEKANLEERLKKSEDDTKSLITRIEKVTKDRDSWKKRLDALNQDKVALDTQIQKLIVENEDFKKKVAGMSNDVSFQKTGISTDVSSGDIAEPQNNQYWASVLKAKASLEVSLNTLREELSQKTIEILDLKQGNQKLKLELDSFRHNHEEMRRELAHKSGMIDSMSIELARTKNEKKHVYERIADLNNENQEMRAQMKKVVMAKGALEKSIVRLTQDKNNIEKQLGHSETLIQSKIDDIWEIKQSIDRSFKESKKIIPDNTSDVQLPPIRVRSGKRPPVAQVVPFDDGETVPGFNGAVVSVNTDNNFVIIDIGQHTGIKIGDELSVYRDNQYVGRIEVIQVRGEISAADVKDQWSPLQAGDVIR